MLMIFSKWSMGLLLAACPLILLALIYAGVPYHFASGCYGPIILFGGGAFVSCFVAPLVSGVWLIIWWDRISAICFLVSLFCAAIGFLIFFFDPGHRIDAFFAD